MKITILGAGAFGKALGGILTDNGHEISYYDPKILEVQLDDALRGAEMMVLAVPSQAVPGLVSYLPKDVPMVVATKGLLDGHFFEAFKDWMVLSGPGFADDIKLKKQTYLTMTDRRVAEWFGAEYLHFDFTEDRLGVLMCGALKNVYAILAGLKGLERESEEWRTFITEVPEEMRALLSANGATVDLVCGKGDLELTCGLPSRNYEFGATIRDNPGYKPEKTVEGVTALARIREGEIKVPETAVILQGLIKESEKWD